MTELLTGVQRHSRGQEALNVKRIPGVIVREIPIIGVLRNVILAGEERAHTSHLQEAFAAVHDRQLVHRHQVLAQLLKILSVGLLGALGDAGVVQINGFLAQQRAPAFQRGFFLAAQE